MLKKLLRFTLVGIVGAVIDYSVRTLLLALGMPGVVARAGSYIVGSTAAYYLNSWVTFDGQRDTKEKTRAAVSYLLCFLTAVGVDWVVRAGFGDSKQVLLASWVVSQACATALNFLLQAFWVFRSGRN